MEEEIKALKEENNQLKGMLNFEKSNAKLRVGRIDELKKQLKKYETIILKQEKEIQRLTQKGEQQELL